MNKIELELLQKAIDDGEVDIETALRCLRELRESPASSLRQIMAELGSSPPAKYLDSVDARDSAELQTFQWSGDAPDSVEGQIQCMIDKLTQKDDSELSFRLASNDVEQTTDRGLESRSQAEEEHSEFPTSAFESTTRLKIQKSHARGGLGEVFVAIDEAMDRKVALKQIRPKFADNEFARERFELEASVTGGLEHPGIVPVYNFGRHKDGRPFYAMRFIRGKTLKEAIAVVHDTDELPRSARYESAKFRDLLNRLIDACHAIGYAHHRGVIHRDIKPSNIMLGKYGETLVVDWGLAKHVGAKDEVSYEDMSTFMQVNTSGSQASATLQGSTIGTPPFMPPEQAEGDLDAMGPRSDVYSLGATLYTIITGLPPYQGNSAATIIKEVQEGSFRPAHIKEKLAPRGLSEICNKAMATIPNDRYSSALDLAADIESWIADQPISAWTAPVSTRLRRWFKRNRAFAMSIAIAVATVTFVSAVAALLLNAEQNRTLAAKRDVEDALVEVQAEKEKTQRALAMEVRARQQTSSVLESVSSSLVTDLISQKVEIGSVEHKFLNTLLNQYQQLAESESGRIRSALVQANGLRRVGRIQHHLGDSESAQETNESAISLYRTALEDPESLQQPEELKSGLAAALANAGQLSAQRGDAEEAVTWFRDSQTIWNELADQNNDVSQFRFELAGVLVNKANALHASGKPSDATLAYSRAIDLYDSLVDMRGRDAPDANLLRGQIQALSNYAGQLAQEAKTADRAIDVYRQCEKRFKALLKIDQQPRNRNLMANCRINLANCLMAANKKRESKSIFESVALDQSALVAQFPLRQTFRSELGRAKLGLGRLLLIERDVAAEDELLFANMIFRELMKQSSSTENNKLLSESLDALSRFYLEEQPTLANSMKLEAAKLRKESVDDKLPDETAELALVATEINWANALRKAKRYEQAIRVYQPLLKRLDERGFEPDKLTRLVLFGLGDSYSHANHFKDALSCWVRLTENVADPAWNAFEQQRAIALTRSGKLSEGVNASESLLFDADVTGVMYYDAACCAAIAAEILDEKSEGNAAAGKRDAKWYRKRAIKHLKSASEAGFFDEEKMRVHFTQDSDLNSLRRTDEFKAFCDEQEL